MYPPNSGKDGGNYPSPWPGLRRAGRSFTPFRIGRKEKKKESPEKVSYPHLGGAIYFHY